VGGAYESSENVAEIYNSIAKGVEDATGGFVDFQPSFWSFVFNNYLASIGGAMSTSWGLFSYLSGDKDFVPSRDLPIASTFFTRRSGPDAADYAVVENMSLKRKGELDKLRSLEDETRLFKYLDKHPESDAIVSNYKNYKKEIDKLITERKLVQTGKIYTGSPKERTDTIRYYNEQINYLKYSAVKNYYEILEQEKSEGL
jgi:hypothetical protein